MCIHKHTYNHEATKLFACIRMYYRESDIEKDGDKDEPVWLEKSWFGFRRPSFRSVPFRCACGFSEKRRWQQHQAFVQFRFARIRLKTMQPFPKLHKLIGLDFFFQNTFLVRTRPGRIGPITRTLKPLQLFFLTLINILP